MFKFILNILFIILSLTLFAQDDVRSFDAFKKVKVISNVKVELIKSNEHKAEIWIAKGKLEELKIEQSGGELKIEWTNRPKPGQDNRGARIKLFYKELTSISVSEGARVFSAETINADHLVLDAFSGSVMTLEVKAITIHGDVRYGGYARLNGSTDELIVQARSGSSFKGEDLKAARVIASAHDGGLVKIWATESIQAKATGGSKVIHKGNPSVKDSFKRTWASGRVRKI